MNYTKAFLLIVCAFFLTLLDASFFSAMPLFGATILSSYILALALSISKELNLLLCYVISAVFFFSIFSSLPIWLIVIVFLGVPYVIFYVRKKYFPKLSILPSALFFITGTLIFSTIFLIYNKEWNLNGLIILIYFILINSAIGVGVYYLLQKLEMDFGRKEIRF